MNLKQVIARGKLKQFAPSHPMGNALMDAMTHGAPVQTPKKPADDKR
jgi:hypothetical protein